MGQEPNDILHWCGLNALSPLDGQDDRLILFNAMHRDIWSHISTMTCGPLYGCPVLARGGASLDLRHTWRLIDSKTFIKLTCIKAQYKGSTPARQILILPQLRVLSFSHGCFCRTLLWPRTLQFVILAKTCSWAKRGDATQSLSKLIICAVFSRNFNIEPNSVAAFLNISFSRSSS